MSAVFADRFSPEGAEFVTAIRLFRIGRSLCVSKRIKALPSHFHFVIPTGASAASFRRIICGGRTRSGGICCWLPVKHGASNKSLPSLKGLALDNARLPRIPLRSILG